MGGVMSFIGIEAHRRVMFLLVPYLTFFIFSHPYHPLLDNSYTGILSTLEFCYKQIFDTPFTLTIQLPHTVYPVLLFYILVSRLC